MKGKYGFRVYLFCIVLFLMAFPSSLQSKEPFGIPKESKPGAIIIKSKRLELDDQKKLITFEGEVSAKKEEFDLNCQKMEVLYKEMPSQGKSEETETRIDQIIATGKVRITRAAGGTATAERAVYSQAEDKLVLTGSPLVKQGNDFVQGDRITIFLKENRSIVESSEGKKVKATIFPKR